MPTKIGRCVLFKKLARRDVSRWALTGGVALEIHRVRLRGEPAIRTLNDLDFIVDSFDCIPETLANDFLFRHIHPFDPPGKTILQFIDPDSALRMDVFRACGRTMTRTVRLDLPSAAIQLISLEDLTARTARLVLDLAEGIPVLSKHTRDVLGLVNLADKAELETVWQDHRKPNHPMTFQETMSLLHYLIPMHQDLLVTVLSLPSTRKTLKKFAPVVRPRPHSVGEPKRDPVLVGVLLIVRRECPCR